MAQKNKPEGFIINSLRFFLGVKENKSFLLATAQNFLVIRQHNQLGDALLGSCLFTAIKETYPTSHITAIFSPQNIASAIGNPYIDELILLEKEKLYNPLQLLRFYFKLRKRCDVCIVPATVSLSFTSNLLARLSKASIRIGPNSLDGRKCPESFFFDRRVDLDWRTQPYRHITKRCLDIIRPFGINTENLAPIIGYTNEDEKMSDEFIEQEFGTKPHLLIGFHVGAGKPPNRWNPANFARVIAYHTSSNKAKVYLTGSSADLEVISEVRKKLKFPIPLFLNRPLAALAVLISKSDLFITNDTGIMHVAGSTPVKQICLFGPTPPEVWSSLGKNKVYLRNSDDIDSISPEEVIQKSEELLLKRAK